MSKYRTRKETGDSEVEWRKRLVCRVAERASAHGEDGVDISDEERVALVWWAATTWSQVANYQVPECEPVPDGALKELFSK